jgi:NADH:ubiquinone oxidoreductase subunit 6 (subunit J)
MNTYLLIFYFFVFAAAGSAVGIVVSRNVFYAALLVIICLLSVAAIYIMTYAEFVAVTQIMVYAGGILVVIIFGIMLTSKLGSAPVHVQHANLFTGLMLTVPLLIVLLNGFAGERPENGTGSPLHQPDIINTIGINLMTEYVLPFEIAGVLLLITLIGAASIASHKPPEMP